MALQNGSYADTSATSQTSNFTPSHLYRIADCSTLRAGYGTTPDNACLSPFVQVMLRHPVALTMLLVYCAFCFALEGFYIAIVIAGSIMNRISLLNEWTCFLAADVVSKVINPCVLAALLAFSEGDATSSGEELRRQVRTAVPLEAIAALV